MVDVKDLLNENMNYFMREMTVSLRNDITSTMKDIINTTKGEQQVNLTPNSQPEMIPNIFHKNHLELKNVTTLSMRWTSKKHPTRGKYHHR